MWAVLRTWTAEFLPGSIASGHSLQPERPSFQCREVPSTCSKREAPKTSPSTSVMLPRPDQDAIRTLVELNRSRALSTDSAREAPARTRPRRWHARQAALKGGAVNAVAIPVDPNEGLCRNQDELRAPVRPDESRRDPKQPVTRLQVGATVRPLDRHQLLPERQGSPGPVLDAHGVPTPGPDRQGSTAGA